ncbi:response regulator [Enterococcus sp. BWM-S5]|uniref:Transcriptional regulatory protein n=1 Tax=Enterococcus larvae TaxID=2794352 RepID=A0ABS4CN90_9ENTE|nr:response regulator [Enterococcus larvae]
MTKVLIIEDDPMVAVLNQSFVEQLPDMTVVKNVRSADEAKNVLDKNSIDLILLDVFLPGETGIEFLTWLRMEKSNVVVILITAADDVKTVKEAIRYGAIDYLIKPFTFERFKMAIDKYRNLTFATEEGDRTNQSAIDRYLNHAEAQDRQNRSEEKELPKGLSKLTLKKVSEGIQELKEPFSTKDLAVKISLSRISTKKYLQFLVDYQVLKETMIYLEIGRPLTKYEIQADFTEKIEEYL